MTSADEHSEGTAVGGNAIPADAGLPPTLCVVVDADARVLAGAGGGTVVLGGSPLRLLRLPPPADAVFTALAAGASIGEAARSVRRSPRVVAQLVRRLLNAGMVHPRWDAGPVDPGGVTIVIPVHQRAEPLRRLLGSLSGVVPAVAGLIVVDDGSTDGSGQVAASFGARVVGHATPHGPAGARNAGLAAVDTEFVAFIDSDCVASGDWLALLLPHFADPRLAVAAPRIAGLDSAPARSPGGRALHAYELVRSSLDLGPTEAPVAPRTRVAYVPAAAFVARTAALRSVGGFDATMPVGEDVDLFWRLHANGHLLRYEPASVVFHDHRTALGAFVRRRFDYGTSAAALDRRHPGQVPPLAVSAWSAAAWALAATLTPAGLAAGVATAIGSAAALPRKLAALAEPRRHAWRLALRGHLGAGRQLASAVVRTYLPVALVLARFSRRARWILAACAVLPGLTEWRGRRPQLDPVRYVGIRMLDDASYCAGVWAGCFDGRTTGPLIPDLTSWPGRRGSPADAIGSAGKTGER